MTLIVAIHFQKSKHTVMLLPRGFLRRSFRDCPESISRNVSLLYDVIVQNCHGGVFSSQVKLQSAEQMTYRV